MRGSFHLDVVSTLSSLDDGVHKLSWLFFCCSGPGSLLRIWVNGEGKTGDGVLMRDKFSKAYFIQSFQFIEYNVLVRV